MDSDISKQMLYFHEPHRHWVVGKLYTLPDVQTILVSTLFMSIGSKPLIITNKDTTANSQNALFGSAFIETLFIMERRKRAPMMLLFFTVTADVENKLYEDPLSTKYSMSLSRTGITADIKYAG